MSEEDSSDDRDHAKAEEEPVLTAYEPGFHRVFARGSLLQVEEEYPGTLQIGFWSSKDEGIPVDDQETTGTGYRLEAEVVMNWDAAFRLRELLDDHINKHAPEHHVESEE